MAAQQRIAGNLPARRNRLVGRAEEVTRLRQLCRVRPLVTVTGVGGVGKSRLALEAAAAAQPGFRDGVWWVDLAALRDGSLLAHVIAEALPLADQSTRPMADVLAEYLARRQLLLVLDTCEHLTDACAFTVEPLLRAAPGLRVLATSRTPLGMLPEELLALEPLPVAQEAEGAADAVALLAERAAAAAPGFAVTEANRPALVRLARRLDGLPLAIELAAPRLRDWGPEELTRRLEDRFAVLEEPAGAEADPPWHQALRTAIGWSHQLCSPAERLLWARAAVFAGSFDAEAARQVCADEHLPEQRIAELLAALVDKSIVVWTPTGGGERYRMLDTIREFGVGWLRGLGEEDTFRRRHRDHYLALARQADAVWLGPDQFAWYDRITAELDNLRTALGFCLTEPGEEPVALDLAGTLWFLWYGCGFAQEGRHFLGRALAADTTPGPARTKALWASCLTLLALGDAAGCASRAEECHAAVEGQSGPGHEEAVVRALTAASVAASLRGDFAEMAATADRILALHSDTGPLTLGVLVALQVRGHVAIYSGEPEQALPYLERLRALCDAHGEQWTRSFGDYFRAQATLALGRPDAARRHARDSLRVKHRMHDRMGTGLALDVLAAATVAAGQHEYGTHLLGLAQQAWEAIGVPQMGQPHWVAAREACEAEARTALGAAAYEAAHTAGYEADLGRGILRILAENGTGTDRPHHGR